MTSVNSFVWRSAHLTCWPPPLRRHSNLEPHSSWRTLRCGTNSALTGNISLAGWPRIRETASWRRNCRWTAQRSAAVRISFLSNSLRTVVLQFELSLLRRCQSQSLRNLRRTSCISEFLGSQPLFSATCRIFCAFSVPMLYGSQIRLKPSPTSTLQ